MEKITALPLSLTNEERKYLGLTPVEDDWDLVTFPGRRVYLYFDGDIIRKYIEIGVEGCYYVERELLECTEQGRTVLLPKTKRGKPRKMNFSATQSFGRKGMYFEHDSSSTYIGNYTTNTYFHRQNNGRKVPLHDWMARWMADTTEADLEELERFKTATRRHVKYREGDFFAFKIGRRHWGFGRIVLDIVALRKTEWFNKRHNYGLRNLMCTPLYIMVYRKVSDTCVVPIEELASCDTFPVQAIMDNDFYYGEYKIIGHKSVSPEEWEPIISYGRSISSFDPDTVYLQYGLIYKETTMDKYDKYITDGTEITPPLVSKLLHIEMSEHEQFLMNSEHVNPFRDEGITGGIDVLPLLEHLVATNRVNELEDGSLKYDGKGLRAPENLPIKREIFAYFGLDADKSYAENLKREMEKEGNGMAR